MNSDRHSALSKAGFLTDSALMRLKARELEEIYLHLTNQHGKDVVGYPGTKMQLVREITERQHIARLELANARREKLKAEAARGAANAIEKRAERSAEWEAMRQQQAAEVNAVFDTFPPLEPL